jgi:hypothetical protein
VNAFALWLTALALAAPAALGAQSPWVPGPSPPLPLGYSAARLELARTPRFAAGGKAWVPGLEVDVAVRNSRTRLGAGLARYPGLGDAPASLGGGLSLTRVLVEQDSPARLRWLSFGVSTVRLDHEELPGSRVYEAVLGVGGAKRYSPPVIGEVLLVLAPRVVWRRVSDIPLIVEENAGGAGLTGALDWGSRANLGALLALDLDWLSSRPAALKKLQLGVRGGLSYRFLLFPRVHPMPPPEG